MPLYEYECDTGGHKFELIRKFSDPPLEKCPTCGSTVHKLISSPAIQFKGSGWYITDYARKDSAAAGKTGGGKDGSSGETDSASKSDESGSKSGDSAAKSGDAGSTSSPPAAPAPAATTKSD
jgi:putative FmdB family regulatory protein